ncbi:hypothetical protein C8Q80DRAFT_1221159 [Daedaleopsis nitida]|nr:hypothetical protein C8Q80DRAFT_1221159 [Daedaleopsis nitida]
MRRYHETVASSTISPSTEPAPSSSSTATPGVGLEDKAYVRQVVLAALREAEGRRDFALHVGGAKVVSSLTSPSKGVDRRSSAGPVAALQEDLRPGQCWRIRGSSGQLAVGLPELIHITHVTIDHVPSAFTTDPNEAPRKMFLWGVIDGKTNLALYRAQEQNARHDHPSDPPHRGPPLSGRHLFTLIATFEYDMHTPFHAQTFDVDVSIHQAGFYFGIVVLEIVDNWGSDDTCLYRLRIHGDPVF